MYYIFISKENMKNTKDVMLTLRIDKNQYLRLLETLVRERKSKSTFIRESIQKSLDNIYPNNCRKNDIEERINSL
jgi:3-methyladenine DNA glycosylase AlkC